MSTDREGERAERQKKRQRGIAKVTAEASECRTLHTQTQTPLRLLAPLSLALSC